MNTYSFLHPYKYTHQDPTGFILTGDTYKDTFIVKQNQTSEEITGVNNYF